MRTVYLLDGPSAGQTVEVEDRAYTCAIVLPPQRLSVLDYWDPATDSMSWMEPQVTYTLQAFHCFGREWWIGSVDDTPSRLPPRTLAEALLAPAAFTAWQHGTDKVAPL